MDPRHLPLWGARSDPTAPARYSNAWEACPWVETAVAAAEEEAEPVVDVRPVASLELEP